MTRSLFSIALAALIAVAMADVGMAGAVCLEEADIITTTYVSDNSDPKEDDILEYLDGSPSPYPDVNDIGIELYKWNVDGGEEGLPLDGSYEVVDTIDGGGGGGGTIRYTPPGDIVDTSMPAFLIVKGGGTGFIMYDLDNSGEFGVEWDGVMDLKFTNVGLDKPGGGQFDVSHIEIWGDSKPNSVVPEPTTLAIWSLIGVCGIGAARRGRKKKA